MKKKTTLIVTFIILVVVVSGAYLAFKFVDNQRFVSYEECKSANIECFREVEVKDEKATNRYFTAGKVKEGELFFPSPLGHENACAKGLTAI